MPFISISNGTIEEISSERGTTFVTVTYVERRNNRRTEQTVRLVVNSRTVIFQANGRPVQANALRVGQTIDATISAAMTRSIPPQSTAYIIVIVRRPQSNNMTTGRILEVDRRNRSFTAVTDREASGVIRFNVAENARIVDSMGRTVNFSRLSPGMRVRVRHADFMTASIPPQTTAFEIWIL